MAGEKSKPATTTKVPAVTSDYAPTILDILGLKPESQPRPIDGISLLPLIAGNNEISATANRVFNPPDRWR